MAHIFHGDWTRYKPDTIPEGAPAFAMFARRTSDGQDWYEYVHPGTNFGSGSAIFTVRWVEGQNSLVVGSSVRDAVFLFPGEQGVYEIPDYGGDETQLNNKCYDPSTEAFSDLVPPPATVSTEMQSLLDRIAALEAKP